MDLKNIENFVTRKEHNVLLITKLMDIVQITSWSLMIVKSFKLIVMHIVMIPIDKEVLFLEPILEPNLHAPAVM
jgi:hypothetical protein